MKKISAYLLALSMLTSSLTVYSASFDDLTPESLSSIDGHWSEEYMLYLYEKDVIFPTKDATDSSIYTFTPNEEITRAEFVRYINRAFNLTDTTEISFDDVPSDAWYYDDISRAVYWGYMGGTGNNQMQPLSNLTRQEAVVIISRLHNLEPNYDLDLNFTDKSDIASWSIGYIAKAVELGYIAGKGSGDTNYFDPLGNITRAEIAKILYLFAGNILESNEQYLGEDLVQSNVTISEGYGLLSDADIEGTILITNAYQTTLQNVDVRDDIIINSGALTLEGVSAENLIIKSPSNSTIAVTIKEDCNIENIYVYTPAKITSNAEEGVINVIEDIGTVDSSIEISGYFENIELNSENINAFIGNSLISELNINESAENASVSIDINAEIERLNIHTPSNIYANNTSIASLFVDSSDVCVNANVGYYDITEDYYADINGLSYTGKGYLSSANADLISIDALIFREYDDVTSREIKVGFDVSDISNITFDDEILMQGYDYQLNSRYNIITITESLATTLNDGDIITINFEDGSMWNLNIKFVDFNDNFIQTSKIVYDFNTRNDDLEIEFFPVSYDSLSDIYIDGQELTSRDYTYDENGYQHLLYIDYAYLSSLPDGKYEVLIEMNIENDLSFILEIKNNPDYTSINNITVVFEDKYGNKLNGVKVIFDDKHIKYTDVNGEVVCELSAGKYTMEYSKTGYETVLQWIDAYDENTFLIKMY